MDAIVAPTGGNSSRWMNAGESLASIHGKENNEFSTKLGDALGQLDDATAAAINPLTQSGKGVLRFSNAYLEVLASLRFLERWRSHRITAEDNAALEPPEKFDVYGTLTKPISTVV